MLSWTGFEDPSKGNVPSFTFEKTAVLCSRVIHSAFAGHHPEFAGHHSAFAGHHSLTGVSSRLTEVQRRGQRLSASVTYQQLVQFLALVGSE